MTKRMGRRTIPKVLAAIFSVASIGAVLVASPATASTVEPAAALGDALSLRWMDVPNATEYLIVDDYRHQVLSRSTENKADLSVTAPDALSLLVVALTKDDPIIIQKVLATIPERGSTRTPMTAVTTTNGTRFSWGALAGVNEYIIEGDNISATVSTTPFVKLPARLGETAHYDMYAKPEVHGEITETTITDVNYGIEVSPPTTDVSQVSNDTQMGDVLPAGIPTLTSSHFVYETYIPMQYMDAPENGYYIDCESGDNGEDWWYNGNNRTKYDYNKGNYKTVAAAYYSWENKRTSTGKGIGTTKRYKKVGTSYYYNSSRTASMDKITVRPIDNDGRIAHTSITHDAGHPYCTPFATITYEQTQTTHNNGGYGIWGQHDKMPNHQQFRRTYYSDGSTGIKLLFDHPLTDPKCLNYIYGEWKCGGMWEYQVQG